MYILFIIYFLLQYNTAFAGQFSRPEVGKPHSASQKKFIEVYGHRGARSYSPENTIPGYSTALKVGIHWADMDIVMSKDHQILVYHNLFLNPDIVRDKNEKFIETRTKICDLTAQELKQYDVGMINPENNYAKFFPNQVPVNGTKIPLLQEVITYIKKNSHHEVGFQIEIKSNPKETQCGLNPDQYAKEFYKILKKNQIVDRAEIQSFDWRYLYALQKLNKNIKTSYLVTSNQIIRMKNPDAASAGFWTGGKLLKDYNFSLPQMVKKLGGSSYEPEDAALTQKDLEEAHKLGLKVVVWTWPEDIGDVFNTDVIIRMIDWGVDGIITDDPGRLNSMLAARGYPVPKNYPGNSLF